MEDNVKQMLSDFITSEGKNPNEMSFDEQKSFFCKKLKETLGSFFGATEVEISVTDKGDIDKPIITTEKSIESIEAWIEFLGLTAVPIGFKVDNVLYDNKNGKLEI